MIIPITAGLVLYGSTYLATRYVTNKFWFEINLNKIKDEVVDTIDENKIIIRKITILRDQIAGYENTYKEQKEKHLLLLSELKAKSSKVKELQSNILKIRGKCSKRGDEYEELLQQKLDLEF